MLTVGRQSARGRRAAAAGICWSTARRSACTRSVDETPIAAGAADRAATSTTSSTTRRRRGCCARRRELGCQTIGGLDMLVAQAHEQFEWWTGARPPAGSCGRPRSSGWRSLRAMKITSFEEFKELARRGTFVPVCKEIVADLLTPVSAFLKIAEHADYAFLLESVEGGEHVGRYSFLGKDPFLILRARDGKTTIERGGVTTRERAAVHRHAAAADGRLPVAVRPGAAALHRRRGRLPRLRRGVVVRAGARRSRASAPTARTRPGSCCSTRCWRSITCSTGS